MAESRVQQHPALETGEQPPQETEIEQLRESMEGSGRHAGEHQLDHRIL